MPALARVAFPGEPLSQSERPPLFLLASFLPIHFACTRNACKQHIISPCVAAVCQTQARPCEGIHAAESGIIGVLVVLVIPDYDMHGMSVVLRSQAPGEAHAHVLAQVRVRVCAFEEIVLEKQSGDANARRCHQLIAMRLEPEVVGPILFVYSPLLNYQKRNAFSPRSSRA